MKKIIIVLLMSIGIGAVITLNSCKKETTAATNDDSLSAQDNAAISNAVNTTSDDAVAVAGNAQNLSEKSATPDGRTFFCGISIIDTGRAGHSVTTITYNGTTNCFGIIRSGSITIYDTSGLWQDAGATIMVEYNNLKITDVVSGSSYTINGGFSITKETAGLEWMVIVGLATNTTVTARIEGNVIISFADGREGMWKFDRTRSWNSKITGHHNIISASVYAQGPGNVDVSGIDRYGDVIVSSIESPVIADNNQNCMWEPYTGTTKQVISNIVTITTVYGTNSTGVQIGTATVCGDGYYIIYTERGRIIRRFVGYF